MFDEILANEYIRALLLLAVLILFSKFFSYFLSKYVQKLTQKTDTDVDNVVITNSEKPVHFILSFVIIYLIVISLSITEPYREWVDKGFFVVLVILFSWWLSRLFSSLVKRWFRKQRKTQKTPQLINKIVIGAIYLVGLLVILSTLGIEIAPLIATLGLGGLAVGLALQETLSNLFAGLHIISDQPIKVGDFVEVDNGKVVGTVQDIGWRSTKIRTLPNDIIIVPNSYLASSIIDNKTKGEKEMSVYVDVGVAYYEDLKKVEKVTLEEAEKIQKNIKEAMSDFVPLIRYNSFGDSNINFTVILRGEEYMAQYIIKHEFVKALKERYDKEDIEISWPVRKVFHGKEENA